VVNSVAWCVVRRPITVESDRKPDDYHKKRASLKPIEHDAHSLGPRRTSVKQGTYSLCSH